MAKLYDLQVQGQRWPKSKRVISGAHRGCRIHQAESSECVTLTAFLVLAWHWRVKLGRRKLAFVFNDLDAAQRFFLCMELLIRYAQECPLVAL